MIENVMVKTHLIVTSIHEEFTIKWCGKIIDTKPIFKNDMPVFTIISSVSRVELNTCDMKRVEECAKKIAKASLGNQIDDMMRNYDPDIIDDFDFDDDH